MFALLIFSFFSNIQCKSNNLVSLRPNYFIFIGYLKMRGGGGGGGGSSEPPESPLDPPLYQKNSNRHVFVE